MKTLTALCFSMLLTACVPLNTGLEADPTPSEVPADLQLFSDGFEQVSRQQEPEAFLLLKNDFPDSIWAKRADDFLALNNQVRQQEQQLKQLQHQLDQFSTDQQTKTMEKQMIRCTEENQRLQKELDISNQRLEALRELTIELELKQP